MRTHKIALTLLTTSLGWSLAACDDSTSNPDLGKTADMRPLPDLAPATPKGVYTLTNDSGMNMLYIWSRAADGTLTAKTPVATGAAGSGASLGSQGALFYDSAKKLFFAANAGEGSVSVLQLGTDGNVTLIDKKRTNGQTISVAESNGYVYTLQANTTFDDANITGFQLGSDNKLTAVANSTKALSTAKPDPAQISFSTDGTMLVVTEKTANKIDTFTLSAGVASNPNVQPSNGMTPFGFAISSNQKLIVSEANGGTANQGSASSYALSATGALTTVSNKLMSQQSAPCWVAIANSYAYMTNAGTNNVTAYKVAADGTLTLQQNGVSGMTGVHPTDLAVTEDNAFLYTLNTTDHTLTTFAINATDGTLTKKADVQSVPMNAVGLVAR